MNLKSFADDLADGVTRVERTEGILKNHLHPLAERAEAALGQVGDVGSVEVDASRRGRHEAEQGFSDGGFTAPALSDEADGCSFFDGKRDVIDGAHIVGVLAEDSGADGEVRF